MASDSVPTEVISSNQKLEIIMTEWNYIQNIIENEVDREFKNRTWAITLCSALLSLALQQQNEFIPLLIIPTAALFWYVDAARQGIRNILLERNKKIENLLQAPTDSALANFKSPIFGHSLSDRSKHGTHTRKSIFRPVRSLFFGFIIFIAILLYAIMVFLWM